MCKQLSLHIVKFAKVFNLKDVVIRRFAGHVPEFSFIDLISNAK